MRIILLIVCQGPPSWIIAAMLKIFDGDLDFLYEHALKYICAKFHACVKCVTIMAFFGVNAPGPVHKSRGQYERRFF